MNASGALCGARIRNQMLFFDFAAEQNIASQRTSAAVQIELDQALVLLSNLCPIKSNARSYKLVRSIIS